MITDSHTLCQQSFDWILDNIPKGPILEIGSGCSTDIFESYGYDIVSIEDNPKYLKNKSRLVPLKDGWYDFDILNKIVNEKRWNLVIVDGPHPRIGRGKYLDFYEKLNLQYIPTMIDDVSLTGRTDNYIDIQAATVKDNLLNNHHYKEVEVGRSCVLLPDMIKNNRIGDVQVFVDGGFANRMSQILTGMVAGYLYNKQITIHYPFTKHLNCSIHNLINLPKEITVIEYRDYNEFKKKAEKSYFENNGTSKIIENGSLHFGIPSAFLIRQLDDRYNYLFNLMLDTIEPSQSVKNRIINLNNEVDAYVIRTLAAGHSRALLTIPDGVFLTTDSIKQKAYSPKTINLQTIFGDNDYDLHRSKEGMIEAVADWFTLFTAKKIIYNSQTSSFTNVHGQVKRIKKQYYYDSLPKVTNAIVYSLLPNNLKSSVLYKNMCNYLLNNGVQEIKEYSPNTQWRDTWMIANNVMTWGVKLTHHDYTKTDKNILFIENGLLNQHTGFYIDASGYFADSSIVTEKKYLNDFTQQEYDGLKNHILNSYGVDYGNFKVDDTLPKLICLQTNGDATMRHYFPAAKKTTKRNLTFLNILSDTLDKSQQYILRFHPHEKTLPENFILPDNWIIDNSSTFIESAKKCSGIITVNSTCATEALVLGLPVYTLGYSTFKHAEVTIDCSVDYSLLNSYFKPNKENIDRYLIAIYRQHMRYIDEKYDFSKNSELKTFLTNLR